MANLPKDIAGLTQDTSDLRTSPALRASRPTADSDMLLALVRQLRSELATARRRLLANHQRRIATTWPLDALRGGRDNPWDEVARLRDIERAARWLRATHQAHSSETADLSTGARAAEEEAALVALDAALGAV